MCSFGAGAQEVQQWGGSMYSMFDLISQGYELKAYFDNSPNPPPAYVHYPVVYFLQKAKELARCTEYKFNVGVTTPLPPPRCSMLVRPQ
jgi:hypothetical protein